MAMRIELERKRSILEKESVVRQAELSCYMTVCNMQTAHKFLCYKSAMTCNYKIENFITAAHYC